MTGKQLFASEIAKKLNENVDSKESLRVEDFIDYFLESLEAFLIDGKRVTFQNLFSLDVVTRSARKGKNPLTGREINIPERRSVSLKLSSRLKEKLNK